MPNVGDRALRGAESDDELGPEELALMWSVDRIVDLLPASEPPGRPPIPWGFDAWFDPAYEAWFRRSHQSLDGSAPATSAGGPLISVLVPVFRPKLWYLEACIDSVVGQMYQNWELCICDDASGSPELSAFIGKLASGEPRVKVAVHRENGGISRTTNDALALASGEFVALLDHDDVLEPDALAEMAVAVGNDATIDIVYSDEDKISGGEGEIDVSKLSCPHFKPDWAPELLLTYPYLGHLLVIRRALLEEVGGFRSEYDGSQDYDVMLRATERARRVAHVPKVLYHWRAIAGSASSDPAAKPWAHRASRRVLEETVLRRKIDAVVEDGPGPGWYHVRRPVDATPSVTIVIPFRDQPEMTVRCLSSLEVAPGYGNFDVVLVDNGSSEPEVRALRRQWESKGIRVIDYPEAFNWAAMNNLGVAGCDSELLLFMNNDIEAERAGWLHAMVELAQRHDVGAVGARLVYPDGVLQHAGVALGIGGVGSHVFAGLPAGMVGYMSWDKVVRPYSAVTGACLMTRRAVFEEIGGFDERLEVAFNDVDYCLRVWDAGYQVLYTPHAELVHNESASRGQSGFFSDMKLFLQKWGRERLLDDPFYNPNLTLFGTWCGLRKPGELEQWAHQLDAFEARW